MGVARPLAGETVGKKPMFWVRSVMVLKAQQHARALPVSDGEEERKAPERTGERVEWRRRRRWRWRRCVVHFFIVGERRWLEGRASGSNEGEISFAGAHGHDAEDAADEGQRQADNDEHQKPAEKCSAVDDLPHGRAALAVAP
jgi:hypothetical protein